MVTIGTQTCSETRNSHSCQTANITPSSQQQTSSASREINTAGGVSIRGTFKQKDYDEEVIDILEKSRRPNTRRLYNSYIHKWELFCVKCKINPYNVEVKYVLRFLLNLRNEHACGYSALNTARSALSAVVCLKDEHKNLGTHPDICRFLMGIFQETPAKPKYQVIWDASSVLNVLKSWSPGKYLSLKKLTCKVVMLFMLVTGQRVQTLSLLNLENMIIQDHQIIFTVTEKLKQFRPGHNSIQIVLKRYREEPKLCVLNYLGLYLKRVKFLRTSNYLFVSLNKPHQAVTSDTISRWVKYVLQQSGIDTKVFGSHSVRSASSSAAKNMGVSIDQIMKNCGWSNAKTFAHWYDKPIVSLKQLHSYGHKVLNSHRK